MVKIRQTRTEYSDVELSDDEAAEVAVKMIRDLYDMDRSYINGDGIFMVFSFTDGHNGDDHYKPGGKTPVGYREAERLIKRFTEKYLTND